MGEQFTKNTEMQESLKKFQEEAKKLEESEALKDARRKFDSIEGEASKTTNVLKEQLSGITDKVKGTVEEVSKSEAVKKAGEFTSTIGKQAETVTKVAENIGKSEAFKTATTSASRLKEAIELNSLAGKVYQRPAQLRKRKEISNMTETPIEVNTDATGVELHKDSKFQEQWKKVKESKFFDKFVESRMRLEESDNPMVRGARMVTDKIQDIFGNMFSSNEISQVLTEIIKMDPNFCREQFLRDCEKDIIPNILEAIIRGDLDILEDWCYEAPFNILATPIRQAKQLGYFFDSMILDIEDIDLIMGKMQDQGPILAISFTAQQILCLRDSQGNVKEGDPEKVMRLTYIMVLCRDQTELDPKAAWRLLEMATTGATEQFL